MTEAVAVQDLGKRYVLRAGSESAYSTLRDAIAIGIRDGLSTAVRGGTPDVDGAGAKKGEVWALRDVAFALSPGDVLGIIGVNGAGKSTLLKLLSRITSPTTGWIRLRGRVASLLEVGTGFHRELTGRENIFLNGAILGMRRGEIRQKLDQIVAFAEVDQFVDTPVKFYSSGMYVRLAFAVAAHLEPDILVIDEVLEVGDAQFQRRCLGKMREVSREHGRTVLFVSHSMSSVRSLCPEALWLDKGRVTMRGPSSDVIQRYLESTLEPAESSYSVTALPRHWPGHGERLRIQSVNVNDGNPVLNGERLSVAVEYELNGSAADVAVEIGFSSAEGMRVLTVDSNFCDTGQDLAESQRGFVEVIIDPLQLQPGRYSIDVAVRSGAHVGLDYLPSCVWIQVLPGPKSSAVVFRETSGLREPGVWSWRRI